MSLAMTLPRLLEALRHVSLPADFVSSPSLSPTDMIVRMEEVEYCKFSITCKARVKILGHHCRLVCLLPSSFYPDSSFLPLPSTPPSIVFGNPQTPKITVCLAPLEYLVTGLGQTSERFNPSSCLQGDLFLFRLRRSRTFLVLNTSDIDIRHPTSDTIFLLL